MTQALSLEPRRTLFHPGLVAAGAALLIAAFVTDVLYWKTLLFQYDNFSGWLLAGGLALAALAGVAFVLDLALGRMRRIAWLRLGGLAAAAVLGLLNAFVHSRDAYTAVVPEGIALSAVVTLILVAVGATGGWSLAARRTAPQTLDAQP
ncbi:MAG: DUF2231 domain-containing protein [Janthinobacterium lividum]